MGLDTEATYSNVKYKPAPGQVWTFKDTTIEHNLIHWRVMDLSKVTASLEMAVLEKLTGKDIGHVTTYRKDMMSHPLWTLVSWETEPDYTIEGDCPECGDQFPMLDGDYICVLCRADPGRKEYLA